MPSKLTLPKETGLLEESVVADCNFRIEELLLLNIPALRSSVSLTLKVLPVTSSAPPEPSVNPPSNERIPPVEVIEPESSCNGLESVRLEDFVSIAEPALFITSVLGKIRPELPSARLSLFPPNSSVPNVISLELDISVLLLNLKSVLEPVIILFKFMLPPLASKVPDVRSRLPCQMLPEFATRVPVIFKAVPSWSSELLISNLPVDPTVPPAIRFRIPPP